MADSSCKDISFITIEQARATSFAFSDVLCFLKKQFPVFCEERRPLGL